MFPPGGERLRIDGAGASSGQNCGRDRERRGCYSDGEHLRGGLRGAIDYLNGKCERTGGGGRTRYRSIGVQRQSGR